MIALRRNKNRKRKWFFKPESWCFAILFTTSFLLSSGFCFSQNKKPATASSTEKNSTYQPVTRILFVLDASFSMLNPWEGKTKMEIARSIISEIADSLQSIPNVETALRVYGHQTINTENDCNDTKLEVPFALANAVAIRNMLNAIRPKGITPLARSIENGASDFPVDASARNIILLVTDGEESCGGDPCAVSLKMQQQHVFLKPFVIGLNLEPGAKSSMDCIGNYFNAQNPEALRGIMKSVVERLLSSAAVRVNLLDAAGNPLETDVDMTFYDAANGEVKYNFYHTLNYRGVPDTLQVDPVITYNMVIHTTPLIEKKELEFAEKKNQEISIPASQGFLNVALSSSTVNNNLNSKIKCIIRKAGSNETVMVQDMNTTSKYLSGSYDLEVLTLPRLQIKNVAVTQSSTTTVKIDVPGLLNISKTYPGYGAIFMNDNGNLIKIYALNENLSNEL
ncbi:MAG: VWA domain-containing protein, partial [Chitinophagales bacterium]